MWASPLANSLRATQTPWAKETRESFFSHSTIVTEYVLCEQSVVLRTTKHVTMSRLPHVTGDGKTGSFPMSDVLEAD